MLKKILITLTLVLLVLLGTYAVQSATGRIRDREASQKTSDAPTGTLQKMIVENGSVRMDLDLNRLNGIGSAAQNIQHLNFAVGANSFFPVLVFNDQLRGPVPGSMALVPQKVPALPAPLGASLNRLAVEKLPSGQGSDLAVRDSNTGFTFFNIHGHQYRLRPGCAVACRHQWRAGHFKRACPRARPSVGRWFSCRYNLHRSRDAADPNRPTC